MVGSFGLDVEDDSFKVGVEDDPLLALEGRW
jgi:hypothetical protein